MPGSRDNISNLVVAVVVVRPVGLPGSPGAMQRVRSDLKQLDGGRRAGRSFHTFTHGWATLAGGPGLARASARPPVCPAKQIKAARPEGERYFNVAEDKAA
jgi:hypothetical protein